MERKNFAALCAAVLCFWLFALALGTAEGVGLRAVMHPEERAVSADAGETAEGTALPAAAAAPAITSASSGVHWKRPAIRTFRSSRSI